MAIFRNGKEIQNLYHNGKQVESVYHNGKKIYQWYLPSNSVLWKGNTAFSPNNEGYVGGGALVTTSNPIELSGKLSNIKNGLIFNFGGCVDTNGGLWENQPDTSTKIPKAKLTNKNFVVHGIGLWANYSVYAQLIDETHISFTSDSYNGNPMSTCIGYINSNNNGGAGDGEFFSICKSITTY